MKNLDIKMNISLNHEGDPIVNDLKLTNNKTLIVDPYTVTKSNVDSAYLYFKKYTEFQDVIGMDTEIITFCNKNKYNCLSSPTELGRIHKLTKIFYENKITENDELRIQLLINKKPLEMYIEKL